MTYAGSGITTVDGLSTYTGTTSINHGTVKLGVATNGTTSGPFGGQNNALTLGGATLDLNGNNLGVGTFATSGAYSTITNTAGGAPATITVGNNNTRIRLLTAGFILPEI